MMCCQENDLPADLRLKGFALRVLYMLPSTAVSTWMTFALTIVVCVEALCARALLAELCCQEGVLPSSLELTG